MTRDVGQTQTGGDPTDAVRRALFTPFDGGGLSLANRVVMSPMTRWRSPGQIPGADVAAYYRRRAENDVGLIITEGTTIDHPVSSYSLRTPAFHGRALDGWRRVVGEVHDAGGRIVPQLWHVGAMRHPKNDLPNPDLPAVSPSGIHRLNGAPTGLALDKATIRAICDAFARAAEQARLLGFDGVELHGAHGYLIDAFLWEGLNQRDDEYGGDIERRARFATEVVAAVRAAVGPDFPLILRISQWKQQEYGARLAETPEILAAALRPVVEAGVDILHCSQRRWWEAEFEGSHKNLAGWMRTLFGKPVITVGSVGLAGAMALDDLGMSADAATDLGPLADRLSQGEFDLVAVGRALLADHEWARKVKDGRYEALRPFTKDALEELR